MLAIIVLIAITSFIIALVLWTLFGVEFLSALTVGAILSVAAVGIAAIAASE